MPLLKIWLIGPNYFDGIINLDTLLLGIFYDGEKSNVIVDEDEYND